MTSSQVWTILRWPLAVLGLLAVVAYALPRLDDAVAGMVEFDPSGSILDPGEEATPTEGELDVPVADLAPAGLEPGTGPVEDGSAAAIADLHVNDTVADVTGEQLVLTDDPADAVVVAFDIPAGDPSCFTAVTMDLAVDSADSAVEVGVFASTVGDPAAVVDNQALEGDLRATEQPMSVALLEAPGVVTFDLTAGFQGYFDQGFEAGRPFSLTIVPTVPVEPQGGVAFTAVDAGTEDAPVLRWTGTPDCPGEGGAVDGQIVDGETVEATPTE